MRRVQKKLIGVPNKLKTGPMELQSRSPAFGSEYYKRRWTIRFCILGLTMLLLIPAAFACMSLLSYAKYSNSKTTILVSMAPFFFHSLQLLSAVVILRSNKKNLEFINCCWNWCRTSRIFLPTISLEIFLMLMWEFNIMLILITTTFYVIAVLKVNQILESTVLRAVETPALQLNERHHPDNNNISMIPGTEITGTDIMENEGRNDYESYALPSYEEAIIQAQKLKYLHPDLPPSYADLLHD